jgi:hypothetical protein
VAAVGGCAQGSLGLSGPDADAETIESGDADGMSEDAAADVSCPPGRTPCGGSCVDQTTDPANCGACGHACAPTEVCNEGGCTSTCSSGLTPCAGSCVDTSTDSANCGACGHACTPAENCTGGACVSICPPGQTLCAGLCATLATDLSNCGSCGNVCPDGVNADRSCVSGGCRLTCRAGYVDLDGAPGCECQVGDEECNGDDDDCDGRTDEGAECPEDWRCEDGDCVLVCDPPDWRPVDGRCLPSCGIAGGNWCPPYVCAPGQDPVAGNYCPAGILIETWDCVPGDSADRNNHCCRL